MSQTSTLKGQCIAEFLGTGLLIFSALGAWLRSRSREPASDNGKSAIIWGLGVAMAIYLTAGSPVRTLTQR
ncbi:aquaglyceroporin [Klebsiella pneumoniae]|uniref:Aquaglyceroporin n=1 Tax=Klebsiella pneumoniae TaxID=573 RepID=A0A378FUQ0_KLEPN|nr:aquaglyceroporin [Klebsiella pneumoniae]